MVGPMLLAIDNCGPDLIFMRQALKRTGRTVNIQTIGDGQAAIEWLTHAVEQNQPLPDLIVLNCYLPRKSGMEVLRFIRTHPALRLTPVIVTGPSMDMRDIGRLYREGATAFVSKYGDYPTGMMSRFETTFRFWFETVIPVRDCFAEIRFNFLQ